MDINLSGSIFDESMVLKVFGAFLGIIALVYFGFDTILNLSPTLKSFVLFIGATGFFIAVDIFKGKILRSFLYIFSSSTYLSFLVYTIGKFTPGSEAIFAALVASAALFMGLGYIKSEEEFKLTKKQSKAILVGIAVLIFAVGIFDSLGATPKYEINLKDNIEVVEGHEIIFGTLEVRNNFLFSRNMEMPNLEGCIATGEEPRRIHDSIGSDGLIGGKETKSFNLTDEVRSRHDSNITVLGNYSIVEGECPEEPEQGTIYAKIDSNTDLMEFMD